MTNFRPGRVVSIFASLTMIGLFAGCDGEIGVDHDVSVTHDTHHDTTSVPLRDMPQSDDPTTGEREMEPVRRIPRPLAELNAAHREMAAQVLDAPLTGALAPTNLINFDGIGNGVGGFAVNSAPPDTDGDVGPN